MTPDIYPIIGHIQFYLELNKESERCERPEESVTSPTIERSQHRCNKGVPDQIMGFILSPIAHSDKMEEKYQLVIPRSLLRCVCNAVKDSLLVRVEKYTIYKSFTLGYNILELHSSGIVPYQHNSTTNMTMITVDPFLSLSQLATLETSNSTHLASATSLTHKRDLQGLSVNDRNRSLPCDVKMRNETAAIPSRNSWTTNKGNYFNFTACVDAISPIIAAYSKDPFALMEMYNNTSDCDQLLKPLSVVVVLKGREALSMHAAIQPGDVLFLHHVRRQRWHVPSSFLKRRGEKNESVDDIDHLFHRVPSHVFVVLQASSILWGNHSFSPPSCISSPSAFPSTVHPLTSILGRMSSISWSENLQSMIHSPPGVVEYIVLETKPLRSKLYLLYYPLSPEIFFGLRKNALIMATNIHRLDSYGNQTYACFGACLRSTVCIVETAGETFGINDILTPMDFQINFKFPPYYMYDSTKSLCETHLEWLVSIRERCCDRLQINCDENTLTQVLLSLTDVCRQHRKHNRDAYAEFFDHACCYKNETNQSSCCHLSNPTQLPIIHGLLDLRNVCLDLFKEALAHAICHDGLIPNIGNTYQDVFKSSRILGLLHHNERTHAMDYDQCFLFTAGNVVHNFPDSESKYQSNSMSLRDRYCQLTCVPISLSLESGLSNFGTRNLCNSNLVFIRVSHVVISCIALGRVDNQVNLAVFKDNVLNMSSFLDSGTHYASEGFAAGCSFLIVAESLFIASAHVHYDEMYSASMKDRPFGQRINAQDIFKRHAISLKRFLHHLPQNKNTHQPKKSSVYGRLDRIHWIQSKNSEGSYVMTISDISESGEVSKQTIDVSVQLPLQYISLFKSTVPGMWLVDHFCSTESFIRLVCGWWLLNESGIPIASPTSAFYGSSARFDRNYTAYDIIIILPQPKYTGKSTFLCNVSQLSVEGISIPDRSSFRRWSYKYTSPGTYFSTISDLIKLKIFQSELPLQQLSVYRLTNVQVLHILFCKVHAKCSYCLREIGGTGYRTSENVYDQTPPSDEETMKVKCLSECSHQHRLINWKCSCIIDDGTGIAQLDADGDTCLKLLGKSTKFSYIEDYARQEPFIYYHTSTSNQHLKEAMGEWQLLLRTNRVKKGNSILDHLSKRAKAEYEFYKICRRSSEAIRWEHLCRISPKETPLLKSRAPIKNISSIYGGWNVPRERESYFVKPLLKLELIDCSCSDEISYMLRDEIRVLQTDNFTL